MSELPRENKRRCKEEEMRVHQITKWFTGVVILVAISLIVSSAGAYQQDFQNYGDDNDMLVYGAYPASIINISGYPELFVAHIATSGGGWTEIYYGQAQAATNWSAVMRGAGTTVPQFKFWDSSMVLIGQWFGVNPTDLLSTTAPVRYDFRYNTANQIVIYKNGVYRDVIVGVATAPRYFSAGGNGNSYIQVDDYTENPAPDAEFNYAEAIPIGYYVIIDAIKPANNGLYFPNGTIVRSNTYYQEYSTLSNATKTWQVVNFQTGTAYETLHITGSTGVVGANVSSLIGAPPGLYRTFIQGPGSSSFFWVVGYGATVAWDKDQYATDETSSISWTILPAYYDTANYNYNGNIVDAYGATKKSWVISSTSGYESTILDSTTYPQGTYFATVTKTEKSSPYNTTTMIYDHAEIVTDLIVKGGVYNTTGTSLPGTHVNITQSGITNKYTATPLYNQTGNTPSVGISINATHLSGWYESDNITFTPPSWGTYNINFYLLPTPGNMTYTGNASIYGLVRDDALYQPVLGATVNIRNATYLSNTTTNTSGFYQFNGLAKGQYYTLWATASGYNQSINYNVNSSIVSGGATYNVSRQDILLERRYNLRVDVKDTSTLAYIVNPVTISITEGITTETTTTTTGYANFTARFALYSIAATSDGYYTSSTTAVISSDRIVTLYLTKTPESAPIITTPKEVKFVVRSPWGGPVSGATVTASYIASTGPTDWFSSWLGVPTTVNLTSANLSGTTSTDGSVTFTMVDTAYYRVNAYKAGVINSSIDIYPHDDTYTLYSTGLTNGTNIYEHGANPLDIVKVYGEYYEVNASYGHINVTYTDSYAQTTLCYVNVNQTHQNGNVTYETTIANYTYPGGAGFAVGFDIHNHRDQSYIVHVNASHTTFELIQRDFGVTFDPGPISLGIPESLLMYAGLVGIIFVALCFTKVGGAGPGPTVIVCAFTAWIFAGMRWWKEVGPDWMVYGALILMTIMAIFLNIMLRSKKVIFD